MTQAATSTRKGFAYMTEQHIAEPGSWNPNVDIMDRDIPYSAALGTLTNQDATVAIGPNSFPHAVQMLRLTLASTIISVTAALNYGSKKLVTLDTNNKVFIGSRCNLSIVKDGVGYLAADTTPNVAVGTVAASSTTLGSTNTNLLAAAALAGTLTALKQLNSANLTALAVTNADIYLNAKGVPGGGVDATLAVSGTIDLYYYDWRIYS